MIRCNVSFTERENERFYFFSPLDWFGSRESSPSPLRPLVGELALLVSVKREGLVKQKKSIDQMFQEYFFVVLCLCVCFSTAARPTSLAYFCQETIQLAEILLCYSSIVFVSSDNHSLFPSYTQHYFSLIVFALNYYESVFKTPPAHHWIRSALVSPPNNSRIPQLLLHRLCPLVVFFINPFPCGMIFTMQIITRRFSKSVFKLRPAHLWIRSALVSSPNNSYIPIHTA